MYGVGWTDLFPICSMIPPPSLFTEPSRPNAKVIDLTLGPKHCKMSKTTTTGPTSYPTIVLNQREEYLFIECVNLKKNSYQHYVILVCQDNDMQLESTKYRFN
jgi:hypothetical protein